jgi:hypothetical protein
MTGSRPRLVMEKDKLLLYCSYEDRERAKLVFGYRWNPRLRCWEYPLGAFDEVRTMFPHAIIDEQLQDYVLNAKELEREITADKLEGWEHIEPTEPMPIKTKPFQHQVLGYELACKLMGFFRESR